jgi:hypothetical protein
MNEPHKSDVDTDLDRAKGMGRVDSEVISH